MENKLTKCDLWGKCNNVKFLEKRLNQSALKNFKEEHCESEKYKKCLYYKKEIILSQTNTGRY